MGSMRGAHVKQQQVIILNLNIFYCLFLDCYKTGSIYGSFIAQSAR